MFVVTIAALFAAAPVRAQTMGALQDFCVQGGVHSLTSGLASTNFLQGVIPSCQVLVLLAGTQTPATIYSNSTGTPLTNPFTANTSSSAAPGMWTFWADRTQAYDVVLSGGIPPNAYVMPITLTSVYVGGGGGTASPPSYSVQFSAYPNSSNFGSDACISINPVTHTLIICGGGTGSVAIAGGVSGSAVTQTVSPTTLPLGFTWPASGPPLSAPPTWPGAALGCMAASGTGTGVFTSCGLGYNANLVPGVDIGAKVNAALTACSNGCEVDIPSGTYAQTTTIQAPLGTLSTYRIKLMPGAVLNYTGSACSVQTQVVGGPTEGNFEISGGQINGTGAGQGGVCVLPTNTFHIHDMTVTGFTSGYAFWLDGPNAGTVNGNYASNNAVGVYATPTYCSGATCGSSPVAAPFSANNINILNNSLPSNGWGVEYFDLVSADISAPLGLWVAGNDVENESSGGILIGRSKAATIGPNNYVEGDPIGIELGVSSGSNFFATVGAHVVGNFFTVTAAQPWDIYLADTQDTHIEDNTQNYGGSETSANCLINTLPYNAGVNGGELGTVVGPNHVELATVGNYLCSNGAGVLALNGAGSYKTISTNYQAYIAYQAFQINTTVTTENVALGYLTANGSCQLYAPAGNTTAIQNARASILAGTSYLSAIGAASVTLAHPSGNSMTFDILCENSPTGGYGP